MTATERESKPRFWWRSFLDRLRSPPNPTDRDPQSLVQVLRALIADRSLERALKRMDRVTRRLEAGAARALRDLPPTTRRLSESELQEFRDDLDGLQSAERRLQRQIKKILAKERDWAAKEAIARRHRREDLANEARDVCAQFAKSRHELEQSAREGAEAIRRVEALLSKPAG